MPEQINLKQAVDALQRHYGGKGVEAARDEGIDLMANAMRQELGISKQQADDLMQQIVAANRVEWVPRGAAPITPESGTNQVVPGAGAHSDRKVTADTGARGYWKIH